MQRGKYSLFEFSPMLERITSSTTEIPAALMNEKENKKQEKK